MQDVQNLAYLCSVLVGYLLPMASQSLDAYIVELREKRRDDSPVNRFFDRNWPLFSVLGWLLLIAFLLMASILLTVQSVKSELGLDALAAALREQAPPLFAPVTMNIAVGLLTGLLIHQFRAMMKREPDVKTLRFFSRLTPVLLLLAFGMFRDELHSFSRYIRTVDTPYVSIDFNVQDQARELYFETAQTAATRQETEFEYGVAAYLRTTSSALQHIARVFAICHPDNQVNCLPMGTVIEPFHGPQKPQLDPNTLAQVLHYSRIIQEMRGCILNFKERFRSGVPIQDELSEIAIEYASSLLDEDVASVDPEHARNIEKIIHSIYRGARMLRGQSRKCQPMGPESLRYMKDFRSKYAETVRAVQRDIGPGAPDRADYFPYYDMIGTSFLLASGHAVEAAFHLDDAARDWLTRRGLTPEPKTETEAKPAEITNRRFGTLRYDPAAFDGLDLLTFQVGLELLARREYMFDRAGIREHLPTTRDDIRSFVGLFLSRNSSIDVGGFSGGGTDTPDTVEPALAQCTKLGRAGIVFAARDERERRRDLRAFFPSDTDHTAKAAIYVLVTPRDAEADDEAMKAAEAAFPGEWPFADAPATASSYLRDLLFYWTYLSVQHTVSLAEGVEGIGPNRREAARNLYDVAVKKPGLLRGCFGEDLIDDMPRHDKRGIYDWRVMRTLFAFAYAKLEGFHAQTIQKRQRLLASSARGVQLAAVKQSLCAAEDALRVTLQLAEDVRHFEADGDLVELDKTVIADRIDEARSMLSAIPPDSCP